MTPFRRLGTACALAVIGAVACTGSMQFGFHSSTSSSGGGQATPTPAPAPAPPPPEPQVSQAPSPSPSPQTASQPSPPPAADPPMNPKLARRERERAQDRAAALASIPPPAGAKKSSSLWDGKYLFADQTGSHESGRCNFTAKSITVDGGQLAFQFTLRDKDQGTGATFKVVADVHADGTVASSFAFTPANLTYVKTAQPKFDQDANFFRVLAQPDSTVGVITGRFDHENTGKGGLLTVTLPNAGYDKLWCEEFELQDAPRKAKAYADWKYAMEHSCTPTHHHCDNESCCNGSCVQVVEDGRQVGRCGG